ncbi:hypothetical protein SMULJ23_1374 [Streptococcus mutans LJ23]|nr:hypothetical protein SMULJ23_1374 [Streptococcus mutans LJ23]
MAMEYSGSRTLRPYLALGIEAIGIVSGAYAGVRNGWGDGGFW